MGCRTGFYIALIGTPNEQEVSEAWLASMQDVLGVQDRFYSRIKYLSLRKLYGTFLRRCNTKLPKCYLARYRCK